MRLKAPLTVVVGALALRLAIGVGFVNYDTLYSLVWGQQIARGQTPSYHLALAPTPIARRSASAPTTTGRGAFSRIAGTVSAPYLGVDSPDPCQSAPRSTAATAPGPSPR